jgi:hypothetical protein
MRYLMYCRSYGSREYARKKFRSIAPETRALMARMDFAAAEERCPRGMAIGRLMHEAAAELS